MVTFSTELHLSTIAARKVSALRERQPYDHLEGGDKPTAEAPECTHGGKGNAPANPLPV